MLTGSSTSGWPAMGITQDGDPGARACRWCARAKVLRRAVLWCPVCDIADGAIRATWQEIT